MTFLTSVEAQTPLDAIPTDTWTNRRDRAMFTLASQTGLRLSEITSLQIADMEGAAVKGREGVSL
jgi:integrase/recombinase XerD